MLLKCLLGLVALSLLPARARLEPSAPALASPRATIAHYNGLGVNLPAWDTSNGDVPTVVVGPTCPVPAVFGPTTGNADNAKAVGGQQWGPILNLGGCITNPGFAIIRLRPQCANGTSLTLPGGCPGQILQSGALIGTLNANHNGLTCNVPNQLVPVGAIGSTWSVQATVREFGVVNAELSTVLYGVVDACF